MRRVVVLGLAFALAACELVAGIQDKTLVPQDGGGDAAAVADPSVPCSQQPPFLYCNDFDTESSPGDTWDWDAPMGGGSIVFDTTDYKTPPRSVQVLAPPVQLAQAQLGKKVGSLSSGFRLAFDLRVDVDSLQSIAEVGIGQVLTGTVEVNYVLGPGPQAQAKMSTVGNTSLGGAIALPLPPIRTWTRIVVVYDAVRGVSIEEDGQPVGASPFASGPPGDTEFIVGAVYTNPPGSPPFQFELDNVVMRGQ
jgi:hypothetical protein